MIVVPLLYGPFFIAEGGTLQEGNYCNTDQLNFPFLIQFDFMFQTIWRQESILSSC
jgi:hypothetical protein